MKGNDTFPGKVITADEVPKVSGGEVRDISAEVLDLLRHIRDQVDKLCSLPPEVLDPERVKGVNCEDDSHKPGNHGSNLMYSPENQTQGYIDAIKDKSEPSKSISKRVAAQKPTKVIKTVDDVKEIVAASKDRKAKK